MKENWKISIGVIGILILLMLGVSIIQDLMILIFKNNIPLWGLFLIRLISAIVLLYVFIKYTNFGKEIDRFLLKKLKISKI